MTGQPSRSPNRHGLRSARWRSYIVGLLCAGFLAACGSSGSGTSQASPSQPSPSAAASSAKPAQPASAQSAQAAVPLHVTYSQVSMSSIQTWVAQDKGIFKKNGLNVTLELAESATGMAALLSGQTQISEIGGTEAVDAVAGGADLVVLATAVPVYPYTLEALPSIKTAQDLRGKKIGITKFGSTIDTATRLALGKLGVPVNQVTLLQLSSLSARTAALLSGSIDAGLSQPPDSVQLEDHGLHPLLDLAASNIPAAVTLVVGQRSWVNSHKDTVQKFIDSFVEGITAFKNDESGSVETIKRQLKMSDQRALDITYKYYASTVFRDLPVPKPEQFKGIVDSASEPKIKNVDLNRLIDPSFVNNATKAAAAH